jgi:hypothetical protein
MNQGDIPMKVQQPGSHIDHMLRQTRIHHVQLSSMADVKANMLVTMASVVITLSLPRLIDSPFKTAALVLIAFCFVTIVLAVYASMPKLPFNVKEGSADEVRSKDFNLLFFGDFSRLTYDDFEEQMEEVLNDPSRTYEVQIKEIYVLGKFLAAKKYRYLRLAYVSFVIGLFASGTLFLLASG